MIQHRESFFRLDATDEMGFGLELSGAARFIVADEMGYGLERSGPVHCGRLGSEWTGRMRMVWQMRR